MQRGHDQLVDILLRAGGEVGGSCISSLLAPTCLGSASFGQHTSLIVDFTHLEGFSVSAKRLKDVVCVL